MENMKDARMETKIRIINTSIVVIPTTTLRNKQPN